MPKQKQDILASCVDTLMRGDLETAWELRINATSG